MLEAIGIFFVALCVGFTVSFFVTELILRFYK